jgi:hypothetical protein
MAQPKPLPPLATLRQVLSYDPETGALSWLVDPGNKLSAGALAGRIKNGYIQVRLGSHNLYAHRVAWYLHHGTDPGPLHVDHINRNRSDNRICNLRLVDAKGNRDNSSRPDRPVQVCAPGGEVRRFPSVAAAARFLGRDPKTVYRYAQGQRQPPNGLIVSFA